MNDVTIKSHFKILLDIVKRNIDNSLKEVPENQNQNLKALKKETQNFLTVIQENMCKQVDTYSKKTQKLIKEIQENWDNRPEPFLNKMTQTNKYFSCKFSVLSEKNVYNLLLQ